MDKIKVLRVFFFDFIDSQEVISSTALGFVLIRLDRSKNKSAK